MNMSFNLLDEQWIPVRMTDGSLREVNLLEVFGQADQIGALAEASPPSLIAFYRLLLAITHRALAELPNGWKDRDRAEWYRHGLPIETAHGYLERWRECFWLFHPERPFMQVAALATAEETRDNLKPWTQISLPSATGNSPVVFDHSFDSKPSRIRPGLAIRTLLGFLQFTPGGLVKVFRASDKAGPLSNSAASVPIGSTLNETLSLCLHPWSRGSRDIPCWEKPSPTIDSLRAEPQPATGENDRYTRLSRAVLLHRSDDGGIEKINFAAGVALAEDANAPDPMASYRAGSDKLVRFSFRDGRAFWRDLPALVPDAEGKAAHPAAVLGWAANLKSILGEDQIDQVILVAGVTSDQAKLLRWRTEQIALPLPLMTDASLAGYLREKMREGEDAYYGLKKIAMTMLAETMPDPNRKETRERARDTLDNGPAAQTFFAGIESDLPRLLALIAATQFETAQALWSEALQKAALKTWDLLRQTLGKSPAALRAEARAFPRFRSWLRSLRPEVAKPFEGNQL
jgi:CRISPR system Cascade subunit CasA